MIQSWLACIGILCVRVLFQFLIFLCLRQYLFFWLLVETEGVPAPTTLADVTYITPKISHPTIYTKRNIAELFNQSALYYLTLYTERYPVALLVLYAVSTTEFPLDR